MWYQMDFNVLVWHHDDVVLWDDDYGHVDRRLGSYKRIYINSDYDRYESDRERRAEVRTTACDISTRTLNANDLRGSVV